MKNTKFKSPGLCGFNVRIRLGVLVMTNFLFMTRVYSTGSGPLLVTDRGQLFWTEGILCSTLVPVTKPRDFYTLR